MSSKLTPEECEAIYTTINSFQETKEYKQYIEYKKKKINSVDKKIEDNLTENIGKKIIKTANDVDGMNKEVYGKALSLLVDLKAPEVILSDISANIDFIIKRIKYDFSWGSRDKPLVSKTDILRYKYSTLLNLKDWIEAAKNKYKRQESIINNELNPINED